MPILFRPRSSVRRLTSPITRALSTVSPAFLSLGKSCSALSFDLRADSRSSLTNSAFFKSVSHLFYVVNTLSHAPYFRRSRMSCVQSSNSRTFTGRLALPESYPSTMAVFQWYFLYTNLSHRITETVYGCDEDNYIDVTSKITPWPASMLVQYAATN